MPSAGRVLVIGSRSGALVERLAARGYDCETAEKVTALKKVAVKPDAVVLATPARSARTALAAIRENVTLRAVPVLVDGTGDKPQALAKLGADSVATSLEELERQLQAAIRARRLEGHDELVRRRLELLLEITRSGVGGLRVEQLVPVVARRLKDALGCDQVSVLQLEGTGPRKAWLVDESGRTAVDLAVTPTLRRALETREPVSTDGGWVYPIASEGDVAAIQLRRAVAFEREERDFLDAVGVALASVVERQRAQETVAKTRATLETAYLDRFHELVEANNRLKALDRKKNELLSVLSHDLRAPLNVLLGHAHILLTDADISASQKYSAETIQRTVRKVLDLVETLLEKSRTDEKHIVLFTRTMDVSETCQDTVRELQILAKEKGLALRCEAPMSLPVLGDEQKIRQVVQNLVTNAMKHAAQATQIVVRARLKTRPDGDVALVEVKDDGKVRDPNELLLAFDQSKGLGLSICREFVDRHGGEIWAEAPPEGGALFSFTLPIKVERDAVRAPPRLQQQDAPLVLLAEDDPVFQRIASMALAGHYRVETARDGNEAVARAKSLSPDVIVMDVFMPNRDGLDALRELQRLPETSRIPVVLISSNPELATKLNPTELGAVDHLTKPFPLSVLLTRVSTVLQRAQAGGRAVAAPGNDLDTGLFDQLGIVNRLDQEISRSVRYGRPLTLAVLKPVMPPGDKIRACAALVRRELRAPDVVGHLGGGLLAVILPETPGDGARPLIGRLCSLLEGEHVSYRPRIADIRDASQGAEQVLEQLLA